MSHELGIGGEAGDDEMSMGLLGLVEGKSSRKEEGFGHNHLARSLPTPSTISKPS